MISKNKKYNKPKSKKQIDIDSDQSQENIASFTNSNIKSAKWKLETTINLFIQLLIVVLTGSSLYYTSVSIKQTEASQKRENEQFLLLNHPYVTPSNFEWANIETDSQLIGNLSISNYGSYPAKLISLKFCPVVTDVLPPDTLIESCLKSAMSLPLNLYLTKESGLQGTPVRFTPNTSAEIRKGISLGINSIYIFIAIDYKSELDKNIYRNITVLKTMGAGFKITNIVKNDIVAL